MTVVALEMGKRHIHHVAALRQMDLRACTYSSKLVHVQKLEATGAFPIGGFAGQSRAVQVEHGRDAPVPKIFLEPIELGTQGFG
jgi:hypothetical protein